MKRIGVLSDTHGYLDDRILDYFAECHEIWHAGDIGNIDIADQIARLKPFRAVHGNIDGQIVRKAYPEINRFMCEEVDVLMKHIGGYPGNYDKSIREYIKQSPPKLFISGHSHILKVIPDTKLDLLHINPGAAGKTGLHRVRTIIRFSIDKTNISNLEVIELNKRV